jgi:hypothetical protein
MERKSAWRERYAGYEPELHQIEQLFRTQKGSSRSQSFDGIGARNDWRLCSSAPLKATRKHMGVKA